MRKNQKGFTLVELIIAVAILSVVTLAICGFIAVSSRSYTSANTDIMLQQEAQLTLNQISDVIIDTTDSINYGNGSETVLKDSEFSSDPATKTLIVVNRKDGNNDNPSYRFDWVKDDQVIYFNTSDTVIDDSHPAPVFDDSKRAILAQHVREIHIDISQFEENRVVMISMTFENGSREYTTSNNVTVRNRIALNKIDVEPMKKAEDFTITTVASVTLEPGDHYTFAPPLVEGNDADKSVKWKLAGDEKNGSTITSDGALTIGQGETRQSFLVQVTRAAFTDAKSTKEVRVNIKRVNSVNLSCADTVIQSGGTATVTGGAVGNLLGQRCESISCAADDLNKDWDLCDWTVISGPATLGTTQEREAEIKINSGAKAGDEIIIEASSDLSKRKNYGPKSAPASPPVKGRVTIKVTKGNSGDFPIKSGFKFGTADDPGPLDYMRHNLKTDYFEYVFCVRVREVESTDALNDQVIMYHTKGANERFFPDMFGLELNRTYNIFFQVLDPVSIETREKKYSGQIGALYADDWQVIVNEYLSNLDPVTGKYTGDKYEAGDQYGGSISPPTTTFIYNGVTYPNDNKDYHESYAFFNEYGQGADTVMGQPARGDVTNIAHNSMLNNIRYSLYMGEGNDPSTWTRIWGFDADTLQYDSTANNANRVPGGAIAMEIGSQMLKRTGDNSNLQKASGMYHIVPGFDYANNPNIYPLNYIYKSPNVRGDYENHYYELFTHAINLEITMGLNLELPAENGQEVWTFFPVPTDAAFPFDLKSSSEQSVTYTFRKRAVNGNDNGTLTAQVNCKYVPGVGGAADSYTITLSSKQINGNQVTTRIHGKYSCKVGKDQWERQEGPSDKTETINTNLTFTKNGSTYNTYFPAPSESGFPFKAVTGEQTAQYELVAINKWNSWDNHIEQAKVKCVYNSGVYTIELIVEEIVNGHKKIVYSYGKFEYSAADKMWKEVAPGTRTEEPVWAARLYFTYNGQDSMLELPAPGEKGFPKFTNSYKQNISGGKLYNANDTYGEGATTWINFDAVYEHTGNMYTVTLQNPWNASEVYGKWQCAEKGTTWTKIN